LGHHIFGLESLGYLEGVESVYFDLN